MQLCKKPEWRNRQGQWCDSAFGPGRRKQLGRQEHDARNCRPQLPHKDYQLWTSNTVHTVKLYLRQRCCTTTDKDLFQLQVQTLSHSLSLVGKTTLATLNQSHNMYHTQHTIYYIYNIAANLFAKNVLSSNVARKVQLSSWVLKSSIKRDVNP